MPGVSSWCKTSKSQFLSQRYSLTVPARCMARRLVKLNGTGRKVKHLSAKQMCDDDEWPRKNRMALNEPDLKPTFVG
jgi:hypothetical protein